MGLSSPPCHVFPPAMSPLLQDGLDAEGTTPVTHKLFPSVRNLQKSCGAIVYHEPKHEHISVMKSDSKM